MTYKLILLLFLYPFFTAVNLLSLGIVNLIWGQKIFSNFIIVGRFCEINTQIFQPYDLAVVLIKLFLFFMATLVCKYYKLFTIQQFLSVVLFMSTYGCIQEILSALNIDKNGFNYFFSDKEAYSFSAYLFGGLNFIFPLLYTLFGLLLFFSGNRTVMSKRSKLSLFVILPLLSCMLYVTIFSFF
ncbi:hypothetical protein BH11BAC4_BH11BAC4_05860 [soil metagenome]